METASQPIPRTAAKAIKIAAAFKLADELARPVALGLLPRHRAEAALAVAALRAVRCGQIDADPLELLEASIDILDRAVGGQSCH